MPFHPRRFAGSARGTILTSCLTVLVVATGCGGGDGEAVAESSSRNRPEVPPPVETARAETAPLVREVTVPGVVEPRRTVGVNSQISGELREVLVEEGRWVEPGDVLARFEDRELRAEVASVDAALEEAEAVFRRAEQLHAEDLVTAAEYDTARSAYASARADMDLREARLAYTVVRAPVAGVITDKNVEQGDVVGAQSRLFSIADTSTLVSRIEISELEVVAVAVGDAVRLALDAFPGRMFEGSVRRIFPAADPGSRRIPVEVVLGEAAAQVARPGFLARVTLILERQPDALVIPTAALLANGEERSVFVIEEGHARRRPVTTGLTVQDRVQILSGLEPGTEVVAVGHHRLRDGEAVRTVPQRRQRLSAPSLEIGGEGAAAVGKAQ